MIPAHEGYPPIPLPLDPSIHKKKFKKKSLKPAALMDGGGL